MGKLIDLTGQRFGRLTVVARAENAPNRAIQWRCKCDCGKEATVVNSSLKTGRTRSCGCLSIEKATKRIVAACTTHGQSKSRLYGIWGGIKARCNNSTHRGYSNYGGRGIAVCDEWFTDYQKFSDWAWANGYQDDLSIDRIDNDKGYCPENCRWVSRKEQNKNKRNNKTLEIAGEQKTLIEWCEKLNLKPKIVRSRINRGWTPEEALGLEPRKKS